MKLQNNQFINGKLLELLNANTYYSNFWDTTLICNDGVFKQNRLIAFLILPLLCKSDLLDILDLELEQTLEELTIILPDTAKTEVNELVMGILKGGALKFSDVEHVNSASSERSKLEEKRASNDKKQGIQYVCEKCNVYFETRIQLRQHVESLHTFDISSSKTFEDRETELQKVPSAVTNTNKFKCENCDYSTGYKQHLKQHVDFVHKGIGHLCDHCGFKARDKGQLKNHVLVTHRGVRFKCRLCDFEAKSKGNLKQHVESIHKGLRHSCEFCAYSTPYVMNLKTHIKVAHEGFRYECDICEYKATSNGRLKTHKQVKHDGIRYSCHLCEYKGTVKASLKRHVESVHQGVKYPCSQCEYRATSRQHLKIHVESMHEMIRYPCDQCAFQATTRGHLKTHIKLHHGN